MASRSTKARMFGHVSKVDEQDDGTVMVEGIASSPTPDSDGETFTADCMRECIPDYMSKRAALREMHQPICAGVTKAMWVDDDGYTRISAHVIDPVTVKKVQAGALKMFSIDGNVPPGGRDPKNRKTVHKLILREVSLVDIGANPDAMVEVVKLDTGTPEEEPMDNTETQDNVRKGLYGVSRFADLLDSLGWQVSSAQGESLMEGDNSPVPAKMRAWLAEGGQILQAMAQEEVEELLAALKPTGELDAISMGDGTASKANTAEGDDHVAKGGKKFSAETKEGLDTVHKAAVEAHDSAMKAMKASRKALDDIAKAWAEPDGDEGGKDNDGDGDGKDEAKKGDAGQGEDHIQKAQRLEDTVTKLEKTNADLVAKAAGLQEEKDALRAELDNVEKAVNLMRDDLLASGALRIFDKTDDDPVRKGAPAPSTTDSPNADTQDPLDGIRKVHATGGTPINNRAR